MMASQPNNLVPSDNGEFDSQIEGKMINRQNSSAAVSMDKSGQKAGGGGVEFSKQDWNAMSEEEKAAMQLLSK